MNTKRGLIIALDGVASSGKSTTAKLVAQRLGYMHIDTGAMYRAVALKMLRCGVELTDNYSIDELLRTTVVSQREVESQVRILLDGLDVTDDIRTPEISLWVGPVSEHPRVREHLVRWQRELGFQGGVVLEGRDIGTVVFPDADLKVFMTADLRTRARRRRKEMLARGIDQPQPEVEAALEARDLRDSTREHSPLRKAAGRDGDRHERHDYRRPGGPNRETGAQAPGSMGRAPNPMRGGYGFVSWLSRTFFRLKYGLSVHGLENLPRTGPRDHRLEPPLEFRSADSGRRRPARSAFLRQRGAVPQQAFWDG